MAVSPQAMTIMFMPNSPTPPSGIRSIGGTSVETCRSNVVRMRPQFRDLRVEGRTRMSGSTWPGASSAHRGGSRWSSPPDSLLGQRFRDGRNRLDYSTAPSVNRVESVRKPRDFCKLQGLGAALRIDPGAAKGLARG